MTGPDADDTTPGAFSDEWAKVLHLEDVREDITIRARVFVGQSDHSAFR